MAGSGFPAEKHAWFATTEGTPQGGIISPALANWTLDGLQRLLDDHFARMPKQQRMNKIHLVRYEPENFLTYPPFLGCERKSHQPSEGVESDAAVSPSVPRSGSCVLSRSPAPQPWIVLVAHSAVHHWPSRQQDQTEVDHVVRQRRPQRRTLHLPQATHQQPTQPPLGLQFPVDRLDGRTPLLIQMLGHIRTHPLTPLATASLSVGLAT